MMSSDHCEFERKIGTHGARAPTRLHFESLEPRQMLAVDLELFKDIWPGLGSGDVEPLYNVDGTLYFWANDAITGEELWTSDGTPAGTKLVKDINPGPGHSQAGIFSDPVKVGGTLFFSAYNDTTSVELWKSDGTASGTVLVKDINPGSSSSQLRALTNLDGTLYFWARTGGISLSGYQLWKSDGTEAGTVLVKDTNPGSDSSGLGSQPLTNVGGTLYFAANDGSSGFELWKSDGTALGTIRVKDIFSGAQSSSLHALTNLNGTLYFSARGGNCIFGLWKSDGTETGTVCVKENVWTGYEMTNLAGILYFGATDGSSGYELWKSDGTETGTVRVKDIQPGPGSSLPFYLTNVGGTLFFQANDGSSGIELWKSDGTEAGTVRVKDINPGSERSVPRELINAVGTLYFTANDGSHGYEVWESDGTEAGTVQLEDITGDSSSAIIHCCELITVVNDRLFVSATNSVFGRELWSGILGSLQGDFDRNGSLELADLDALVAAIASATNPLRFDLDNNALVNQLDLDLWLQLGGAANLPSGDPYLPGDANLNGAVDGSDFGIWNSHKFTFVAAWSAGDFNADGQIDGADFGIWNAHKFTASDMRPAAVKPALSIHGPTHDRHGELRWKRPRRGPTDPDDGSFASELLIRAKQCFA